jgi:hypothetical protein
MILPPLTTTELHRRESLQPHLAAKWEDFRTSVWVELHQRLYLASATRSFDQQNAKYAEGRDGRNGQIVTNARAGQSWHNFGLAFDVAIRSDDVPLVLTWEISEVIGKLGELVGLEWGERWHHHRDNNHFQVTGGITLQEANLRWSEGYASQAA